MAMFQTAEGATNWSSVVLVLIVPFVLGFICCLLFVKETGGKSMDELAGDGKTDASDTGMTNFIIMLVVIAFLFITCIVCPLAITDWSKLPIALPLMAVGVLLPFVYFFIFATPHRKAYFAE